MIIDCEASLIAYGTRPTYSRAKIGLGMNNGSYFVIVITARTKEKLRVVGNCELRPSTIRFTDPKKDLYIKADDGLMLKMMMTSIRNVNDGKCVYKLPSIDQLAKLKPNPTSLNIVGSNYSLSDLRNKSLRKVIMNGTKLIVPKQVFNLNLVELHLIDCGLDEIPERLYNITASLRVLNISKNKITKLDASFFIKMRDLIHLDISGNLIRFMPLELGLMSKLVALNLNDNQLHAFPITVSSIKHLSELSIGKNQFKWLSGSLLTQIRQCMKLTRFDISNNPFISFDEYKEGMGGHFPELPTLCELSGSSMLNSMANIELLHCYLPRHLYEFIQWNSEICLLCKKPVASKMYSKIGGEIDLKTLHVTTVISTGKRCISIKYLCYFCYIRQHNTLLKLP